MVIHRPERFAMLRDAAMNEAYGLAKKYRRWAQILFNAGEPSLARELEDLAERWAVVAGDISVIGASFNPDTEASKCHSGLPNKTPR